MQSRFLIRYLLAALSAAPAAAQPAPTRGPSAPDKKLIEFGWDEPDTTFMRKHAAQMDASPFDGCVYHLRWLQPDGKDADFIWSCWGRRAFTRAEVRHAFADLEAIRFRRMRHNFLRFNVTPGDLDWFDDYSAVLGNARLAAQAARIGGVGILFDTEQYQSVLFDYRKQPGASMHTWEEYATQARLRGREVMNAMQEGFPGLKVLMTFGYGAPWQESDAGKRPLRECTYGLLAPFLDGMTEAARDGSQLIDGWEHAYSYFEEKKFRKARQMFDRDIPSMVADRARYDRVFSLSFGLWMDYRWKEEGWYPDEPWRNPVPPDKFENLARIAMQYADEYVWIYTEAPRWWTDAGRPEKLPSAYAAALEKARRPSTSTTAPGPAPASAPGPQSAADRDRRLAWWTDARFGLFVHWGLYAIPANEWKGLEKLNDPPGLGAEWVMYNAKIPVAEYEQLAPKFNPTRFDAEEWVDIARAAGMRYIVITAKHCDGFAMYGSRVTPYNIVDATPFKRDPLAELRRACDARGMRLGFYYSHSWDWHEPDALGRDNTWDFPDRSKKDINRYLNGKAFPQVKELLSRYAPDILWFDVPNDLTAEHSRRFLGLIRDLRPDCIVNSRIGNNLGDYETPEQFIPGKRPAGPFEVCMTTNNHWGFDRNDHHWKSPATVVRNLVDIVGKGGNYLLNVGPTADGTFPPEAVRLLRDTGRWMQVNGEAVYGAGASPLAPLAWGGCTSKPGRLYLHVFDWPVEGRLIVPGIRARNLRAFLLADPSRRGLAITTVGPDDRAVELPADARDPIDTVVVLEYEGRLETNPLMLLPPRTDGTFTAETAQLHGGSITYVPNRMRVPRPYIGSWTGLSDRAGWEFRLLEPGTYDVMAEYGAAAEQEGGEFEVAIDGQTLSARVASTGDELKPQRFALGRVSLGEAKPVTLTVRPRRMSSPKGLMNLNAMILKCPGSAGGTEATAGTVWLESLDLRLVTQDTGVAQPGLSAAERPLTVAGRVFRHGVGSHSRSEMKIDLGKAAGQFAAMVGVDDEAEKHGSVVFEAWVDGRKVHDSGVVRGGEPARPFVVDLAGAQVLTLIVTDAGDGSDYDHADWADAAIVLVPGAAARPRTVTTGAEEPVLEIAHGVPDEPRINGPRIVGTTPGRPFIFRVPATGKGPLTFSATGLPGGLQLDPQTGIITGSVTATGSEPAAGQGHLVRLEVSGPAGIARRELTILAGRHKLALTPPLGWNSWNVWGCAVDDARIRAAADAMVSSGLAAHGFNFINIDDCWQAGRAPGGEILANEKFPDMKGLADYIHARGLRFGLYSSPGPKTCGGHTGSYQHEAQDARTWAAWGVDYVKYDWCSYGDLAGPRPDLATLQKPYRLMREALDDCGRDIVFSLCQYGMGDVWTWGGDVGGNLWRTTGDINDSWESMSSIGFDQGKCSPHAGPGRWNDPDMLVVGRVGWGPRLRDTKLTRHEQITHITLWTLLAAPLLIGCDMTRLDPLTIDLLANDDVLAVNQDSLGRAATRRARDGAAEVWARPLADGTVAVGLFNRGLKRLTVTSQWSDLGLKGPQPVRDLWRRKDLGTITDRYQVEIPRRGAVLLKVGVQTSRQ